MLLVSNIKVDGKPIGAFGEGEFWFHIHSGYTPRPYKYTFLHALELPSCGGNTMFSNMYKAYEAVPPALKEKLKGKTALHIHEYNRLKPANSSGDISGIPHHAHPIFITHPDTGRKTLFVDRLMTTRIEGVSQQESDDILDQLYEIGERREFIFEHVWQLGDFLMWDNRCTITPGPISRKRSAGCCAAARSKANAQTVRYPFCCQGLPEREECLDAAFGCTHGIAGVAEAGLRHSGRICRRNRT